MRYKKIINKIELIGTKLVTNSKLSLVLDWKIEYKASFSKGILNASLYEINSKGIIAKTKNTIAVNNAIIFAIFIFFEKLKISAKSKAIAIKIPLFANRDFISI